MTDKKSAVAREAGSSAISTLCENGAATLLEPHVISSAPNSPFPVLLETFADKAAPVKDAALAAVKAMVQSMNPWATFVILPALLEQVKTAGKWQVKTGCLDVLQQLIVSAPDQIGRAMPDLIPVLAGAVWDTKADVKKAAKVTLEKATALVQNKDVSGTRPDCADEVRLKNSSRPLSSRSLTQSKRSPRPSTFFPQPPLFPK